ncbi:two-component system chemotaxis sensor kinase CheA [Altererythrobacter atlanticus]|uniref:Chemotaxis protein CheA n=1 Tax=Croceibacterium atlanticum TaxID=1267766 RepID=A0A0F7KTD9_9SPHN|nr:chemotaxis protein CheA [Croceibacterium atlanticum]AKH43673.1 Chemotaxis protein CheA [Croceibacterium atlanticum]MBB5733843.1 two-component system chemotaxis sensor kinase CheA [Croceibacterium atlanticum]
MDDLLAEFLAETREMVSALSGELVAWEANPADRDRLDTIFRFFHTVKGNCGFFDFPRLEALSHAAEDALADVRAGRRHADARLVDLALAVIDRIEAMLAEIEERGEIASGDDADLIAALSAAGEEPAMPVARPGGPGGSAGKSAEQRTIRLPVDLIDQVMSGVSEMVLVRNDLSRRLLAMGGESGLEAPFTRLSNLLNEVRDAITRTRMRRIEGLFTTFPRLVRDLSAELGKQVLVDIESGEVELDREVIELIRDPLLHIIRNAIDHGIETPEQRRNSGKHECGLLTITARQSGNTILIGVMDDGRGIDDEKLVAKAVDVGLLTPVEAEAMNREERIELMFEAGLSTAAAVTQVSGRGVGMDVVRANIEKFGGSLEIESAQGEGTRFLINVPLTLSILPSLTLRSGEQTFALPRSYVEEIVSPIAGNLEFADVGERRYLTYRDRRLPCVNLGRALGLAPSQDAAHPVYVVLRLGWGDLYALEVDAILDHQELVIKPLAPALMKSGYFVGCTQLDDGSPVLVLDVASIGYGSGIPRELQRPSAADRAAKSESERDRGLQVMLLRDLAGRRQAVPVGAVAKVERVAVSAVRLAGADSTIACGDDIVPLAGIPDQADLPDPLLILHLADGERQLAYAVQEVADVVWLSDTPRPAAGSPDIAGLVMVGDEITELLDCHALFARRCGAIAPAVGMTCRLVGEEGWMRGFLGPIVEAAGYRLVSGEEEADIAFVDAHAPQDRQIPARRAIRLHSQPLASGTEDGIYRYDRAAVMAALLRAGEELAA